MIHSVIRLLKSAVLLALGKLGYGLVKLPRKEPQDSPCKSSDARASEPCPSSFANSSLVSHTGIFVEAHDFPRVPLEGLLDLLESYVRPLAGGKRILVWPFERTGATGHLAMEPFYIKSVFGNLFDEIVVITRHRHSAHNSNTEIFDVAMSELKVAYTDDERILRSCSYEIGIVERGPFTFLLHSYAYLSRAFFHHCLNGKGKAFYDLSHSQEERGRNAFRKIGIPDDARIVTAHARESGFHPRDYDNYRSTSIESYFDSISHLVNEGYHVLRIGDRTMKRLPDFGPQVIDVPFLQDYEHILDVFAISQCSFMLSAHSGPCMLARAFNRPCLAINVSVTFAHVPGENDMIAFRRYYAPGTVMSKTSAWDYQTILAEYFKPKALPLELERRGYPHSELSSAEVLPIVREMQARVEGTLTRTPELHGKFMSINRMANRAAEGDVFLQRVRQDWYGCAKPGAIIPDAYHEINSGFL